MEKAVAIIPTYNEEKTIAEVLKLTKKCVDKIIVVDNASADMTVEIAKKYKVDLIQHKNNLGKAQSIKDGITAALKTGFGHIITLDADMEHDPREIPVFLEHLKIHDAVIGERVTYRSGLRNLLNGFSSAWFNFVIPEVKDVQCGYRAYRRELLSKLDVSSKGFEIEMELLLEAVKNKASMKFIVISSKARKRSNLTSKDYILMNNFFDRWILKNQRYLEMGLRKKIPLICGASIGLISGGICEAGLKWMSSS